MHHLYEFGFFTDTEHIDTYQNLKEMMIFHRQTSDT